MISKFWLYFYIIFNISGIYIPNFIFAKNIDKNSTNSISKDYLNNLPSSDYIIGSGDTLSIVVSQEIPQLTSEVTIDGEGTIYLPRLKRVYVDGLTINELNTVLNQAYQEFIKFPSVETKVINYRPIRVLVQGEVANPGLKTMQGFFKLGGLENNINNSQVSESAVVLPKSSYYFPTVFDALRESGGITEYSDLSNIQIIRKDSLSNGGDRIETKLNFETLLSSGDNTQNIRIYNSDIIKVKRSKIPRNQLLSKAILSDLNPKYIEVFIVGRVNNPGKKIISSSAVLNDAVQIAGGAKIVRGPANFIRINNDGSIDKRKFRLSNNAKRASFKNPLLKGGDLIVIGDSVMSNASEIITEFTSPLTGVFSTYGLIKAISE